MTMMIQRLLLPLLLTLTTMASAAPNTPDPRCERIGRDAQRFTLWSERQPLTEKSFDDALGRPRRLAGFQGRPVLLHFWGTWCPPCLEEMPALDRLAGELSKEALEIIAVNRDAGGTDSTLAFYMKHGIRNLSAYSDRLGLFAHGMHVGKVPVTIYI
ncbi:MAG: hypothetical protein B0D87_02855, partial [Candidatus Sedimenticola endophacoides]